MRSSDYNIHVPLPDSGEYIMIHGYSGAVDVVQPEVVAFLQRFREGDSLGGCRFRSSCSLLANHYQAGAS